MEGFSGVKFSIDVEDGLDGDGKPTPYVEASLRGPFADVVSFMNQTVQYNPFSHLIDELKHELESLAGGLKSGLESEANSLKSALMGEANTLKSGLESTAKTLEGDLQGEYNKLSSDLENGVKTVLQAILSEIEKGALTKAVNLIKLLAPDSSTFGLGPFTFNVDNVHDRISDLQHFVDNPPASQSEIVDFIKVLAPGSVTVEVGIQLSEIFVTSSDESLKFSGTWMLDDFLTIADDIFKLIA